MLLKKTDLIDAIATQTGMSKTDTKKVLESFIGVITTALKNGGRVAHSGFGSWNVSTRSTRKSRNPQTGKEITIPTKKVVKLKPGQGPRPI